MTTKVAGNTNRSRAQKIKRGLRAYLCNFCKNQDRRRIYAGETDSQSEQRKNRPNGIRWRQQIQSEQPNDHYHETCDTNPVELAQAIAEDSSKPSASNEPYGGRAKHEPFLAARVALVVQPHGVQRLQHADDGVADENEDGEDDAGLALVEQQVTAGGGSHTCYRAGAVCCVPSSVHAHDTGRITSIGVGGGVA